MKMQVKKYYDEGYNDFIPTVMTNVIYRINNPEINKINEEWWNEIKKLFQ